ncbi:MAG: aminotransferase class III-fold pyridoxal phosphate-dependent enzyme, partial [Bryobacterales bacterium]|nr:aminotransferase class III-fold pyridoxal phosphate-dependent enzyme [Bryobacterales bacterium]
MDRYTKSRAMLARAAKSLTGGVSSPFRAKAPVPLFFADGNGPRLTDVDGNGYIDYALAWGPLILGHKHPVLVDAMRRQAEKPHNYG